MFHLDRFRHIPKGMVVFLAVILLTSCRTAEDKSTLHGAASLQEPEPVAVSAIFQKEDREVVEQNLTMLAPYREEPVSLVLARAGKLFLDTPYVAHTIERDKEALVVNLRELDCTTYAEYCLAFARTVQSEDPSFEQYLQELQRIRYRDGQLNGYPSRLHYFCDWIHNNAEKGIIMECAAELGGMPLSKEIHFMSSNPENYQQLKNDTALVSIIRQQEDRINQREIYYIPEKLLGQVEDQLKEGDVVGITTEIEGLAVMHVGILIRSGSRIHLMHASSAAGKVMISEEPLESYLIESDRATGIIVARPI